MTARTYIPVDGTATRLNGQVRYSVDRIQQAKADLERLNLVLAQAALDGGPALAAQLGLTEDDAAMVNALVASAVAELDADSFLNQLITRLG